MLQEVRTDLPRGYYDELPIVTDGTWAGLPRINALAVTLLTHTDSHLTEPTIARFVKAFQAVTPLTTGELWAVPIMLRVALLENLRRLADEMLAGRADRKAAAERVRLVTADGPLPPAPDHPSDAYLVAWTQARRMHESDAHADPLRERLGGTGDHLAEVLRREHRRRAANQVSIGNCVTSLRLLNAIDWNELFEQVSLVEAALRAEPTGVYARQDFQTRDRYRQAVERLAKASGRGEVEVVEAAVARGGGRQTDQSPGADPAIAGSSPAPRPPPLAAGHIGYHLIGDGREAFARALGCRPRVGERWQTALTGYPNVVYFGGIAAVAAAFVLTAVGLVMLAGGSGWAAALTAVAALLPATDVAVALVNFAVCRLVPPRVLPKFDFKDGVPAEFRTVVVIPGMLARAENATALCERLELHYLANPDAQFRFALLTDWADADTETTDRDADLVQAAVDRIRELNDRHAAGGPDKFYMFHRARKFNPSEGVWMGWERKRGKLDEFNRLLLGATDTSYTVQTGNPADIAAVFVLTLDADTVLPREAARRIVAALAHPLNRPVLSDDRRRVVSGYGLLQPRVSFLYGTGLRSRFAKVFAGNGGIDPYASASSDVYQDLFGRGTFTGKGLFDVAAFQATAGEAFPENAILSHDLIESNFARCGLVTDVEVFDDFPAKYHAYARREHRWVRGDWQLLPWLFPTVPTADGRKPNVLPLLGRWKIFDNLRRSLAAPGLIAFLAVGWLVLPGPAWAWSLAGIGVIGLPLVLQLYGVLAAVWYGAAVRGVVRQAVRDVPTTAGQIGLSAVFLANQAAVAVDAIGRTLYRLVVSRRRFLEWETAAAAEARLGSGLGQFARIMWPALAIAFGLGALVIAVEPWALPGALPWLLAWLLSPVVAFKVSQPLPDPEPPLEDATRTALRRTARKTWRFFETFVTAGDNWLPPDNFQEDPKGVVAHRTSPTNKGLLLLSTLSAHDLGYLTLTDAVDRCEKAFDTFDKLERYRGHFLNWYETDTLKPLPPAYVSTVDSGNLLGCLLAFKHGLLEKRAGPVPSPATADGLLDTLDLAVEGLPAGVADELRAHLATPPADPTGWDLWLTRSAEMAAKLPDGTGDAAYWVAAVRAQVKAVRAEFDAAEAARPALAARLDALAKRADGFADAMDFKFLYNDARNLFSIGYTVPMERLDPAHYDLLASESAITSFLCVARGVVPRKHWFQLGRLTTRAAGMPGLISWGGTLFEYLMPRILLAAPPGTLLDTAQRAAVARQQEYGRQLGLPWGVSESGFAVLSPEGDYQYQSFGVPGLGLKRGLGKDRVVAPYATLLATLIDPAAAVANFPALRDVGGEGPYGFYEAIDFTPERVPPGETCQVVRSYMAHHQGMGLCAIANRLNGDAHARRLRAEPAVRAVELLLQERVPLDAPEVVPPSYEETQSAPGGPASADAVSRRLTRADTPAPRTHFLSNGQYTVLLTNSGAGFSTRGGLAVTRWRNDPTRDDYGSFFYLRDAETGRAWAATHHPTGGIADYYEVIYSVDKAEFRRRDGSIESYLEVAVAPDQDVEVRRLTVINHGTKTRLIEVTSYAEVVLNDPRADLAHPAFGKLFLETEWLPHWDTLLCRRRPRSPAQSPVFAVHTVAWEAGQGGPTQCETDRAKFIGRRRTTADPEALHRPLTGTVGPVLDPIFSLRRTLRLPPGSSAALVFTTGVTDTRDAALALADQYHAPSAAGREFDLAWAHSRVELRHLGVSMAESHLYQRLAGHVLFPPAGLRYGPALVQNKQAQPGLWRYGISGDLPMVVVCVSDPDGLPLAKEALKAHAFWRGRGFVVDLILLADRPVSYFEELFQDLNALARASDSRDALDRPGGVFVRKTAQLGDDRTLVLAAARVVLFGDRGTLAVQTDALASGRGFPPNRVPARPAVIDPNYWPHIGHTLFWNGTGGFMPDGKEYVIAGTPPMPWSNVIANPDAGCLATDSGLGYTWHGNSQSNRLTPWSNDPVSDPPGEVVYLRDEETGEFWSPTPVPCPGGKSAVWHGAGYTSYAQERPTLGSEVTVFVAPHDPVKVVRVRVHNRGDRPRKFAAVFYAEWVLGTNRDVTAPFVVTEIDPVSGAVFARNAFNPEFGSTVAFADVSARPRTATADRTEFLGRNGSVAFPAAMRRAELSGHVGPGLDPCAALMARVDIPPGQTGTVVFVLGQAADAATASRLAVFHRDPGVADATLVEVIAGWDERLSALQVKTPDAAFDMLVNRWLPYQTLSCRVWGRSAFYQSGGAYGFRDQLQDVMALLYADPGLAREHILRSASRQFLEGDVQHWWHPPAGQGVRTKFSDDFLWLPYAAARYVEVTGDAGIFDTPASYLHGPKLGPDQHESYFMPDPAVEAEPLYRHCLRALDHGWQLGPHGLPLIGCGDWNDGMNLIGVGGKGESVWVAWFQILVRTQFARVAEARGDTGTAERLRSQAEELRTAVAEHAWDGAWYRRAWFDDGTPLGSVVNDECQIDSLPQTWAVIAGSLDTDRAERGMNAAVDRLVDRDARLVKLFSPPFDDGPLQPGYIKGYVPGTRENGGQYTHAAIWMVQALAGLGRSEEAFALWRMLSPVGHADAPDRVAKYMAEPYVVAADVYGMPPHVGRGGWTWYTGSAGWLYRAAVESLLGFVKHGDEVHFVPRVPADWKEFELIIRNGKSTYHFRVDTTQPDGYGADTGPPDATPPPPRTVRLHDAGGDEWVSIVAGRPSGLE